VIRCHGVLHGILATAVDSRMITRNPASGAALPKVPKRSPIHLTGEQLEAFIAEAGAGKSTARRDGPAIVAVLGYCALRWGEIAALTPESLFQTRRGRWRFLVDRQDVTTGGEAVRTTPKTDDNRGVPIPERVMTLLRPIIDATAPGQRLFPAAGGRAMKPPGNDTWWSAAVERCQKADPEFPDVSPHKLRHTAISLAIYAGGSVLAVQRLAGHSSITTTYDRYGHLMADELDEVADAMDRAAERVTGKKYNENTTHPQNQDNFCKPQADAVKGK
jgi:integrase